MPTTNELIDAEINELLADTPEEFFKRLETLPDPHAQIAMAKDHIRALPTSQLAHWMHHPACKAWVNRYASHFTDPNHMSEEWQRA